jgi:hypothetical protein
VRFLSRIARYIATDENLAHLAVAAVTVGLTILAGRSSQLQQGLTELGQTHEAARTELNQTLATLASVRDELAAARRERDAVIVETIEGELAAENNA